MGLTREQAIYIGALAGVLAIWQLVQYQQLVGQLLVGFGGLMLAVVLIYAFAKCSPEERDRMLVATALIVFSVLFWALFEQAGSSLNLFADRSVDRSMLGYELPASVFQSLNALFIFLLAPLFSILWTWLAARGKEPSTPVKFALALMQVGFGFLVLVFGASLGEAGRGVGMIWLVLIYLLHTTGELCLSPVGLSMVTKLSVPRVVGMMMGVWFLASAGANYIAGQIARFTGSPEGSQGGTDMAAATLNSMTVYTNVGWLAVGIGVLLLALSPWLRKAMHGVH